jgi:hypothetical protein
METDYKTKLSHVDKIYQNKTVQSALDLEYVQLLDDRKTYRDIFLKVESNNPGSILIDNSHQMPVNVFRIIE